jgi:FKBP-type peptidyl-prolyl cis-trans isomerase
MTPIRSLVLLAPLALGSCAWFRADPPEYAPVQLESGLVIRDEVVPDSGPVVAPGDVVALRYELRVVGERTPVESSAERGQPLRFTVGEGKVPAGLEEGVLGMRLYGRRRLDLPSTLAFGSAGRPPRIPPDAPVVFDIELMEHEPAPR